MNINYLHNNEKIEHLKKIALFHHLSNDPDALQKFASLFIEQRLGSGSIIFSESDQYGDSLYIIKAGTVEIVKRTAAKDSYTVAKLSDNVFFGEMALVDPDVRSATVRCVSDCQFYILKRRDFLEFGNAFPVHGLHITRELARIVCQRLRKSNQDVIYLFDALVQEVEESGGLQSS